MQNQRERAEESVDAEWIELMQAAKNLGLSIEEIKEFFAASKVADRSSRRNLENTFIQEAPCSP